MRTCKILALVLLATLTAQAETTIVLDGRQEGRTFEGIGALSAGASSRLLIDYPEPQRSQILDYLFKPQYGAAFHHFKVEIGGDANSTDGSEPSHMHTRDDESYTRGYEWWLMTEARKRNPVMILDCLEWGVPGWIGDGTFYSQDNADYIVKFLQGAKRVHGLDIAYTGIWNEMPYDVAWIKLLRETLDRAGLGDVQIVAADQCAKQWAIVDEMNKDPALMRAIGVVGEHYPKYKTTDAAKQCDKPLWASEDGPWKDTWEGAWALAKTYNRNYIDGRMTKTIVWALATSYYDILPLPNGGFLKAKTPWSGHYEIAPPVWITAHTTQFTQPGWRYLDGDACGYLPGEGSYVALKSPDGTDYTVICETVDATESQSVVLQLAGGLPTTDVHVWRTSEKEQFIQLEDLRPVDATVTITLDPGCVYTLSTTTGQQKATTEVPPDTPFPMPYQDDFESYAPGATPKYLSDQGGCFEVVDRADGNGRSLRQVAPVEGTHWNFANPEPETFLGNREWRNYRVSADVLLDGAGYVALFGRVAERIDSQDAPRGYCFKINEAGAWELRHDEAVLASGATPFSVNAWHNLAIVFQDDAIRAFLDGTLLAEVEDTRAKTGLAGVGSGWNHAQFDNFVVQDAPGQ